MFENYAVTAFRNIVKYKTQSLINIVGLAVGLAASLLILLYVQDEFSWDSWIDNGENIYRLEMKFEVPGRDPFDTAGAPGPIHNYFADYFPEVLRTARVIGRLPSIQREDGEAFYISSQYVDPEFLEIIDFDYIEGDAGSALTDPSSIVLSEETARMLFGDEPAMGQTLIYDEEPVTVSAVIRDLPRNTHMDIDMMRLFVQADWVDQPWVAESWTSVNTYTYVELAPGTDPEIVRAGIPAFLAANVPDVQFGDQMVNPANFMDLSLIPLSDIHLFRGEKFGNWSEPGDIRVVLAFSAVAAVVLLIAAINFMNLATARSTLRAREVAMRKVVGATRRQLILQFLGESILLTAIAMVVAVALVEVTLPYYNQFIDRQLTFDYVSNLSLIGLFVGIAFLVGLLGGLYPAFYLSQFRPAQVLKANQSSQQSGSQVLRAGLVVLQFAASIVLIISTAVIFSQTQFALNTDKGYNENNLLVLRGVARNDVSPYLETLRNRVQALPNVEGIAFASDLPTIYNENNSAVERPGVEDELPIIMGYYSVDWDYPEVLGLNLIAGRYLDAQFGEDRAVWMEDGEPRSSAEINVIVNETAARLLGFFDPADAVGYTMSYSASPTDQTMIPTTIVGVVQDFYEQSVRASVRPIMLIHDETSFSQLAIRYSGSESAIVSDLEDIWHEIVPSVPFRSAFIDERVRTQYAAEITQAKILGGFSLLAVFVACLGLFGLAAFSAERRTKEVGIRKSMGASTKQIVQLLVWQFSRPVIIANLIAWPAAWFVMQGWLEGFAHRIDLNPLYFIAASVIAMLIAWGTVSLHAVRAALTRPAVAMRYE